MAMSGLRENVKLNTDDTNKDAVTHGDKGGFYLLGLPHKPNITKEEVKALKEIRKENSWIILTADRGMAMVVSYLSIIDGSSGYHNLKLDEKSYLTTFACQFGRYRYKQLPLQQCQQVTCSSAK